MDCEACSRFLTAYVDHELALESALEVEEHVAACAVCRKRLVEERATASLVREYFPRAPMPETLPYRIRAALPVGGAIGPAKLWAGLAAALCMALGWWIWGVYVTTPPPTVREAVALHRSGIGSGGHSGIRTREFTEVNEWLRTQLPFLPPNALRAPQDAELETAQIVRVGNQTAGWVRYRAGNDHVSLFVLPAMPLPRRGEHFRVDGVDFRVFDWLGEKAILWNHDTVSYILLADSNKRPLDRLEGRAPTACAVCHTSGARWMPMKEQGRNSL